MHRVLVPVEVLEGETVPAPLIEALTSLPVVVLGYHVLPEQTPPAQAKLQFEERAREVLAGIQRAFADAGGDCETRLVFTHQSEQTFRRVADETDCDAILLPNPIGTVEDVLVSLRGDDLDPVRVALFTAALVEGTDLEVLLYYAATDEADEDEGRSRLTAARTTLRDAGVPTERIHMDAAVTDAPVRALGDVGSEADIVVMGESAPSLRSYVFGEDQQRVADRSVGPVLVLRRAEPHGPPEDDDPDA
jgi:nucleotide-binding universal stress UspA family protein